MRFSNRASCLFALSILTAAATPQASEYVGGGLVKQFKAGAAMSLGSTSGSVTVQNGNDVNPLEYLGLSEPLLGSPFQSQVTLAPHTYVTVVAYGLPSQRAIVLPGFEGELLLAVDAPMVLDVAGALASSGIHTLHIPDVSSLAGATLRCQGLRIQSTKHQLLNALDLVIGTP